MSDVNGFGKSAVGLSQSPLGIIALFIALIYSMAGAFVAFGSGLEADEKRIFVYFLVIFPVIVLIMFVYLVARHYTKLFGPANFKNEDNFVKMQINAAVMLTAAATKDRETPSQSQLDKIADAAGIGGKSSRFLREGHGCILWVDDRPENNIYERKAFEAVGLKFSLALSTNEALDQLATRRFEAIISDMGRIEGPREGYVLLDKIRAENNGTPLFFYASSNAPEHKREAERHGAQGCTNNSEELFEMVLRTIINRRSDA